MPYLIMIFSIVMMIVVMGLTRLLAAALVSPMMKMAHNARKIARNDFSGQDLTVPNRDEMGELVKAFNKMKHATEGYINTLKENNEMAGAAAQGGAGKDRDGEAPGRGQAGAAKKSDQPAFSVQHPEYDRLHGQAGGRRPPRSV